MATQQEQLALTTSRQLLRTNCDRLTDAITPNVVRVANSLFSKQLIPRGIVDEMLLMGVITDHTKATKLMMEILNQISISPNPDQYLIDTCHVLIKQNNQQLNMIANDLLRQLGVPFDTVDYGGVDVVSQISHLSVKEDKVLQKTRNEGPSPSLPTTLFPTFPSPPPKNIEEIMDCRPEQCHLEDAILEDLKDTYLDVWRHKFGKRLKGPKGPSNTRIEMCTHPKHLINMFYDPRSGGPYDITWDGVREALTSPTPLKRNKDGREIVTSLLEYLSRDDV